MYPESRPGQFYLIDTECVNGGIPYGENFYVINRFCITRVSSGKCRLRITSQIKYRKNVWGIVKSFIEKNASTGIIDTFTVLGLIGQTVFCLPRVIIYYSNSYVNVNLFIYLLGRPER